MAKSTSNSVSCKVRTQWVKTSVICSLLSLCSQASTVEDELAKFQKNMKEKQASELTISGARSHYETNLNLLVPSSWKLDSISSDGAHYLTHISSEPQMSAIIRSSEFSNNVSGSYISSSLGKSKALLNLC